MSQPVDFIGLNTFIYEPSGWFPPDQQPSAFDDRDPNNLHFAVVFNSSSEHIPTDNDNMIKNIPVYQNTRGAICTENDNSAVVNHHHLSYYKNYGFSIGGLASASLPDPATGDYALTTAGRQRTTASYFHALMLYRNGPYGFPTWKQIRASNNPITRKQRKHNIFTYVEEPGPDIQYTLNGQTISFKSRRSDIKVKVEKPLIQKFKSLQLVGTVIDEENYENKILIKSTLGNKMAFFDNKEVNKYFAVSLDEPEEYQNTKNLYLKGALDSESSAMEEFSFLLYSETVYPSVINVYANYIRSRPNFDYPWRSLIERRIQPGIAWKSSANPVNVFQTGIEDNPLFVSSSQPTIDNEFDFLVNYQSRWVLDAGWNFKTWRPKNDGRYLVDGSLGGARSFDDYYRISATRQSFDSSSISFWPIGGESGFGNFGGNNPHNTVLDVTSSSYNYRTSSYNTDSAGGEGQLMNSYSMFADYRQLWDYYTESTRISTIDSILTASATYSRKHVIPSPRSVVHTGGMEIPESTYMVENNLLIDIEECFGGSTSWQAGELRQKRQVIGGTLVSQSREPFYDTYAKFAEYTRIIGKDYSLVPEYRSSNHVETIDSATSIFSDNAIFEVSGGQANTSSSDSNDFFKIYTNSDFMKHFELVKADHKDFVDPSAISLKCKAIKKFIPYDGFYPAQRTLQLAKQFHKSYGEHFFSTECAVKKAETPDQALGSKSHAQVTILGRHWHWYYNWDSNHLEPMLLGSEPRTPGTKLVYPEQTFQDPLGHRLTAGDCWMGWAAWAGYVIFRPNDPRTQPAMSQLHKFDDSTNNNRRLIIAYGNTSTQSPYNPSGTDRGYHNYLAVRRGENDLTDSGVTSFRYLPSPANAGTWTPTFSARELDQWWWYLGSSTFNSSADSLTDGNTDDNPRAHVAPPNMGVLGVLTNYFGRGADLELSTGTHMPSRNGTPFVSGSHVGNRVAHATGAGLSHDIGTPSFAAELNSVVYNDQPHVNDTLPSGQTALLTMPFPSQPELTGNLLGLLVKQGTGPIIPFESIIAGSTEEYEIGVRNGTGTIITDNNGNSVYFMILPEWIWAFFKNECFRDSARRDYMFPCDAFGHPMVIETPGFDTNDAPNDAKTGGGVNWDDEQWFPSNSWVDGTLGNPGGSIDRQTWENTPFNSYGLLFTGRWDNFSNENSVPLQTGVFNSSSSWRQLRNPATNPSQDATQEGGIDVDGADSDTLGDTHNTNHGGVVGIATSTEPHRIPVVFIRARIRDENIDNTKSPQSKEVDNNQNPVSYNIAYAMKDAINELSSNTPTAQAQNLLNYFANTAADVYPQNDGADLSSLPAFNLTSGQTGYAGTFGNGNAKFDITATVVVNTAKKYLGADAKLNLASKFPTKRLGDWDRYIINHSTGLWPAGTITGDPAYADHTQLNETEHSENDYFAIQANPLNLAQSQQRRYQWSHGYFTKFQDGLINAETILGCNDSKYTKIQPIITPLFAPGVLFNTIKSGVACDYPLMTGRIKRVLAEVSSSIEGTASFWMIGSRGGLSSSFVGTTDYFASSTSLISHDNSPRELDDSLYITSGSTGLTGRDGVSVYNALALKKNGSSNQFRGFNLRIPFEALIEPENYMANVTFTNQEPDNFLYFNEYVRLEYEARWDGQGDLVYKKMAHNFLAEVPEFFLINKNFKKIQSLPQGDPNFGNVIKAPNGDAFEYRMRVRMYRSMDQPNNTIWNNGLYVTPPQDLISENPFRHLRETITMYSRPSSFGPPSWDADFKVEGTDNERFDFRGTDNRNGFNFPFTPPYYHGEAWADIVFKPTSIGKYSVADIINSSSVEYYRFWHPKSNLALINRQNGTDVSWTEWTGSLNNTASTKGTIDGTTGEYLNGNWYGPQHPLFINDNAMQLDSSINLFGKEEQALNDILSVQVDDQSRSRWVIQPKFETPILNFNHNQSQGEQQIVRISFAGAKVTSSSDTTDEAAFNMLDTDGEEQAGIWIPYKDNRIMLYDGSKEYNVYFARGSGDHDPNNLITDTRDAKYALHKPKPNTIRVNISDIPLGSRTDTSLATHFANVLRASSSFEVSDLGSTVSITSSFRGLSLDPEVTGSSVFELSFPDSNVTVIRSGSIGDGLVLSPHSPATTTRGIWHQYGLIPTGSNGIFMRISDIPFSWQKGAQGIHTYEASLTGSLADLVGFSKEPVRLGEIASSKLIKEAVVAIPFVEENAEKKFFEIPRRDIENALETDPEIRWVGQSVRSMVEKMSDYVFPPSLDFLTNSTITPFAMYIFEFSHELSKQDLADIWQNLPPEIGQSVESVTSTITHQLLSTELLGGGTNAETVKVPLERNKDPGLELNDKVRWMVFKVKQKAKTNYYDKVVKKQGVSDEEEAVRLSKSSFNWPYDFFSLVELVKLDATITFSDIEETDDEGSKIIKPMQASVKIDKPAAVNETFRNVSPRDLANIVIKKEI